MHPLRFLLRVILAFRENEGFLLAGAVAYYTLLSIVPLLILLLVLLSHFFDTAFLLNIAAEYIELLAPGESGIIVNQIEAFLDNKNVVGGVMLLVLIFFSSLAFTALENAMAMIFFHRLHVRRRHFIISAIIPYVYIVALGLGLALVSIISAALQGLEGQSLTVMGTTLSLHGVSGVVLYIIGFVGEVLLLTSLYLVMPVGSLSLRRALVGGISAGVLWEISRHILVWYFATLSFVNLIYGSFATTIVILLTFEIGALILLFGAQIIAEFERSSEQAVAVADEDGT